MDKVRVLIVDDSQLIRDVLSNMLSRDARIEVVGTAEDPYDARQKIKKLNPDVITLDVEMPKMNGVAFLKNLMRLRPMPVVMISTLTSEGSQITMQALELGAIDFVAKPKDLSRMMTEYQQEIVSKVLTAASVSRATLLQISNRLTGQTALNQTAEAKRQPETMVKVAADSKPASKIVAIGGSTGSLEALKELLIRVNFTGKEAIVVALHLPGRFTESYAKRLDALLPLNVKEAQQGEAMLEGYIYIAPGGRHLEVRKRAFGFETVVQDNEPVNLHRPSVQVLFDSVAKQGAGRAIAIILTGMGKDGSQALARIRAAGMRTFAQDEASSVVWGMPGAAVKEFNAVAEDDVLDLSALADRVSELGH